MYDKKLKEYKEKQQDLLIQMEEHSKADEDFYLTASKVLDLASMALQIFESSEVNEKRALLNFLLQNPVLSGRNLLFKPKSPFDRCYSPICQTQNWLSLLDIFRTFYWNEIGQNLINLENLNPHFHFNTLPIYE